MDISGVSSTLNKSMNGLNNNSLTQDAESSSTGWKYLTVNEGGYTYTYIVIGKNMKVLISQVAAQDDKAQPNSADKGKKTEDNKTVDAKVNATSNSNVSIQAEQKNNNIQNVQQCQVPKEYGMLTLTASYEKQMREILKEMEDKIGGASFR